MLPLEKVELANELCVSVIRSLFCDETKMNDVKEIWIDVERIKEYCENLKSTYGDELSNVLKDDRNMMSLVHFEYWSLKNCEFIVDHH